MVQTKYKVTDQVSSTNWIDRHTSRIARLKLVLLDETNPQIVTQIQNELQERQEHLAELKNELIQKISNIEGML